VKGAQLTELYDTIPLKSLTWTRKLSYSA